MRIILRLPVFLAYVRETDIFVPLGINMYTDMYTEKKNLLKKQNI